MLGLTDDEELDEPRRVARPPAETMPPLALRGLPGPGSTEDLENKGLESHATPRPVSAPSPLEARRSGDEAELDRLQRTGSGISQVKNPVARGALRTLETVGNVLSPASMMMIPGTELHHNQLLRQSRGRIGNDIGEEKEDAGIAKTGADTEEATARGHLANVQANAAGQPKPKEESWSAFAGYTDVDGTPLLHEANSGQTVRADNHQPPSGFKASAPKSDRPDTPEQQFIDEYQKTHPHASVAAAVAAYSAATQKPEHEPKQLAVAPDGTVVELRAGAKVPQGTRSLNSELKGPTADESRRADLARNMSENLDQLEDIARRRPELFGPMAGRLTGAKEWIGTGDNDVAALKTLKEQTGMAMVGAHAMRNAGHVEAAANAITNSEHNKADAVLHSIELARKSLKTFLSDEARGGSPVKQEAGNDAGGSEPPRPGNVPPNYVYQKNGPKGEGWYKP